MISLSYIDFDVKIYLKSYKLDTKSQFTYKNQLLKSIKLLSGNDY